ncbi:ATP-binding cassette domain-containing protein [Candidatus Wolfebacteria bacterium]|nr:ATP-binding cassette domain-containing protein [Candidatus Wolfebacteria bacterium]
MDLSEIQEASYLTYKGENLYFCGEFCKKRFEKNPEKFSGYPIISLKNIVKIFIMGDSQTEALCGLDLNIWPGDFVAIIGASGSWKSTALNMIGLLDKPSSGKILLNGKNAAILKDEERAKLRSEFFGFVFQQYNLIPWLTAYENVTLPLIFANKNIDKKKIENKFEGVGIKERILHRPFELSGGEQQRVALLRALSNNPEIIIADEPTGNLDSLTGNRILEMLINLNKINKKTLIIVTHDADIAEKADQVIAIKDGKLVKNHQAHKKIYTE